MYRNENSNDLSQNSVEDEDVFTDAQAGNRSANVNAQNKNRRVSTREKRKPERYGDSVTNCIYVNCVYANLVNKNAPNALGINRDLRLNVSEKLIVNSRDKNVKVRSK